MLCQRWSEREEEANAGEARADAEGAASGELFFAVRVGAGLFGDVGGGRG